VQAELQEELNMMEQEELNERLMGADHVPVHHPAGTSRAESGKPFSYLNCLSKVLLSICADRQRTAVEDEEAQLKELQAALAM
jgi:charged multivesicular body protein 4